MRLKKDTRGMTLVEAVAGIAVLVLASLMILSGFSLVMKMVRGGELIHRSGQISAAVVDGASRDGVSTEKETGSASIQVKGGATISVDGPYQTYTEGDGPDSFFRVFGEHGGLSEEVRLAQNLYELSVDTVTRWNELVTSRDPEEWEKDGIGTWRSNDNFTKYIYYLKYGADWEEFPAAGMPVKEDGTPVFGSMKLYIKSYTCGTTNGDSATETQAKNVFVYATDQNAAAAGTWNAYLVYVPEEKAWYYPPNGSPIAVTPYTNAGGVAQLRQDLKEKNWIK